MFLLNCNYVSAFSGFQFNPYIDSTAPKKGVAYVKSLEGDKKKSKKKKQAKELSPEQKEMKATKAWIKENSKKDTVSIKKEKKNTKKKEKRVKRIYHELKSGRRNSMSVQNKLSG
jgi:uncharacterized membrane protein YhiD involved in acid resistance